MQRLHDHVVTLPEGIEAFDRSITLAYLIKTGRNTLARVVYVAVAVALMSSYLASLVFSRTKNQPW